MSAEPLNSVEAVVAAAEAPTAAPPRSRWLFSPRVDVCVFGGSALVSLLLLWAGARAGALDGESPDWAWVPAVLLVDVAHVYATAFRVYFDAEELKRRLWLYALVPAVSLALGVALLTWLGVLKMTRMVSAASLAGAGVLAVVLALAPPPDGHVEIRWLGWAIAAFVIFSHRANLRRIMRGEEPRFGRGHEPEATVAAAAITADAEEVR